MDTTLRWSAKARQYEAGQILFRAGDPGNSMFVIRAGRVKVYRVAAGREILFAMLGKGDFFGEMALLERMPRSATVAVVERAELIEVDAETFDDLIKSNREITLRLLRSLAARVRNLGDQVQRLSVAQGIEAVIEWLLWATRYGRPDDGWVRVAGGAELDLASQTGLDAEDAAGIEEKLADYQCLQRDGVDLLVAEREHLDRVAQFLRLKRQFEGKGSGAPQQTDELVAAALLGRLTLAPDELAESREALEEERERYLELKREFEGQSQ